MKTVPKPTDPSTHSVRSGSTTQKPATIPVYGSAKQPRNQMGLTLPKFELKLPFNPKKLSLPPLPTQKPVSTASSKPPNNLTQPLNNKLLTIAAISAIAVLAIFFLIYTKNQIPTQNQEQPKAMTIAQIREKLIKGGQKTGLDYQVLSTNDFSITYVSVDNLFRVRILKPPYRTNKLAAENWFKDQGATDKQLCYLNIEFTTSEAAGTITQKEDTIPTGCTN